MPTHAVFLDLRKAFDTVSHSHLIDKLSSLDLNISTLNWFSSYLSNRYQYVKQGEIASDYAEVTYGLPQGSVLGPVLFSNYINSLSEEVAEVCLQMYADDTILYSSNLNTLQYNLSTAANWCDQNILTLNTSKTNWMTFTSKGTSHLYQDLQLTINDVQLNKVKQVKHLGLTLDSALAFQDHIVITKQIGNQIYQLSKIRRFLNINAALCIYNTTILPLFDYADIVYEQNLQTVNNKLQVLQNKSLRLIYNTPIDYRNLNNRVTTEELHDRAALITLQNRRDAHALFYAYDLY